MKGTVAGDSVNSDLVDSAYRPLRLVWGGGGFDKVFCNLRSGTSNWPWEFGLFLGKDEDEENPDPFSLLEESGFFFSECTLGKQDCARPWWTSFEISLGNHSISGHNIVYKY